MGDVEVLQPLQAEEALVGEAADGVVGQGQPPQPGHKDCKHFEKCSPILTLIGIGTLLFVKTTYKHFLSLKSDSPSKLKIKMLKNNCACPLGNLSKKKKM